MASRIIFESGDTGERTIRTTFGYYGKNILLSKKNYVIGRPEPVYSLNNSEIPEYAIRGTTNDVKKLGDQNLGSFDYYFPNISFENGTELVWNVPQGVKPLMLMIGEYNGTKFDIDFVVEVNVPINNQKDDLFWIRTLKIFLQGGQ